MKALIFPLVLPAVFILALSPASATAWQVDYAQSRLGFVGEWSGEPFGGTFQSWNAQITFDPESLDQSKVVVVIDLASMTSDEDEAKLETGVRGPQGFDVDAARNARFVTRYFRAAGLDRFEAIADLTIKGMSKEIVLPFTLTITDGVAHAVGEVTIQRTDFAIGSGIWSGERPVAYAVKIVVDITATPLP